MKRAIKHLEKIPRPFVPRIGVILVILLGVIDRISGYEISFSIFYLLPVVLVAWLGKRAQALIISVLSAAIWLYADLDAGHRYSHPLIPLWNACMRLGFFMMAAFTVTEIRYLLAREHALARTDSLTGIANSREFYELTESEIKRAARFKRPFTIAYIDIDNFKTVNDTLGHSQGDILLQTVAAAISGNIRAIDIAARLGGDEFAVFFPETDEINGRTAVDKIHRELTKVTRPQNWPVTFSIGAVTCYKDCNLDELIKEADNLMYSVKDSGKNRIEFKTHGV